MALLIAVAAGVGVFDRSIAAVAAVGVAVGVFDRSPLLLLVLVLSIDRRRCCCWCFRSIGSLLLSIVRQLLLLVDLFVVVGRSFHRCCFCCY